MVKLVFSTGCNLVLPRNEEELKLLRKLDLKQLTQSSYHNGGGGSEIKFVNIMIKFQIT